MTEVISSSEAWGYQSPLVWLVPYTEKGVKSGIIPEDILVRMYMQTRDEKLFDLCCPGMGEFDLNRYIGYFSKKTIIFGAEKTKDGKLGKVIGYAWVTEVNGQDGARNCSIGYCFFRDWWGTELPRHFGWLANAWWTLELNMDVIFGTALVTNRLARNFAKNYGYKEIATVPRFFYRNGTLEDATLSYVEAKEFRKLYEQWLASLKTEDKSPE